MYSSTCRYMCFQIPASSYLINLHHEGEQAGEVLSAVADDDDKADDSFQLLFDLRLHRHRGDVLAARGDDDLLQPPPDLQEAVLVKPPEIAGPEPAVLGEGLPGLLLVPVVPHEDVPGAAGHLADPVRVRVQDGVDGAGTALPDRARTVARAVVVGGDRAGGLRAPVHLQQDDVQALEVVVGVPDERRAAHEDTGGHFAAYPVQPQRFVQLTDSGIKVSF